jgi:hypothetical protein
LSQSGRRNKGRGRSHKQGRGRIDHRSQLSHFDREEDPAAFWQRSNARLGIDEGGGAHSRAPVEFPCAVCGIFVGLERMPKDRHDVVCSTCKGALGGIYDEEDQEAAADFVRTRKSKQRGMLDGLPKMTEEDLEAVGSIKALFDSQNAGRSSNRRRGSSNKGKRRRTSGSGQKSHSGDSNSRNASNRGGSRRRRRGGRRTGSGGRPQGSGSSEGTSPNPTSE